MIIGPEPTTDRFEIISYGKEDGKVGFVVFKLVLKCSWRVTKPKGVFYNVRDSAL